MTNPVNINQIICDVLVIGSGTAGYCAAIQAGRAGCATILIEKDEVLGGNSGPNLGVGISGADRFQPYSGETGIIREILSRSAWIEAFGVRTGSYQIGRRHEAVVGEFLQAAGVQVRKRCYARAVEMDGDRIAAVLVEDMAAFRPMRITVRHVVVDASGDGVVAAAAGADHDIGSEAQSEFKERSAPAVRNRRTQGTSLVVLARNADQPVSFTPPPNLPPMRARLWDDSVRCSIHHGHDYYVKQFREGGKQPMFLYMTELGGDRDTIADDAQIYEDLLNSFWAEWDHLKNGPHAADMRLAEVLWISPKAGKRESRRFLGDVILTQTDLEAGRSFPDDLAYGGHNLDEHRVLPNGQVEIHGHSIPPLYGIPLRACYSRNVANLMLAGRLISATHLAMSSTRVMATGGVVGQGVGWAAALCCRHGCTPRTVASVHLDEFRDGLIERDGGPLARPLPSAGDLAREATASASSERRFNDVVLGETFPLINRMSNLLHDWPALLRGVEVHVHNITDRVQPIGLTVSRTCESKRWIPGEGWCRKDPDRLPAARFVDLGRGSAEVPPNFTGWLRLPLDVPLALAAKDPSSEDDALLVSLDANPELEWSVAEQPHELSNLWENRHGGETWFALWATAAMRLDPPPPLGEAANAIDGWGRRFSTGPTHLWMAAKPGPQELVLAWPEAQSFSRIVLRFDDIVRLNKENPWEHGPRAVPYLVRDYALDAEVDGSWREMGRVEGNHQRLREHRLPATTATRLRLRILAMHASTEPARLYSISVYA